MILVARNNQGKKLGTLFLSGAKLTSKNPALQSLIDSTMRSCSSAKEAYDKLNGFSNGYLMIDEEPMTISKQVSTHDR